MKLFKKLMSYFIALTMVLSLATLLGGNVHADTTGTAGSGNAPTNYNLTIDNTSKGHIFNIYQILKGDVSISEGKYVLSNAKWGSGVTSIKISDTETITATKDEKVSDENMKKIASIKDSDIFDRITLNSTKYKDAQTVNSTNPASITFTVEGGYYVVTDTAPTTDTGTNTGTKTTTTYAIVQIVGPTTIHEKSGTIESEKKVEDVNDSTGAITQASDNEKGQLLKDAKLGDSADYDIGDTINYTIEAKLPENYASYKQFPLTFVDTMSKGLTYNEDAKLHLGTSDTTGESVSELKTEQLEKGSTKVEYSSAEANKDDATKNTATKYSWAIKDLKTLATDKSKTLNAGDIVYITYTATLNKDAVIGSKGNPNKMHIAFNNNPESDSPTTTPNTTPDDTNIVFTYEAVFNKVDQNKVPLTGADFTLYKFMKTNEEPTDTNGVVNYKGVNGKWTDVTTLHNGENKPSKETKANGKAENATFTFKGIDDGYYKLEETGVPSGYNKMEDKYFTITAGHDILSTDPSLTSLNVTGDLDSITDKTATADEKAGTISANIENKPGSTLPSTGGMGTTLLYVAGGILVACAAAYVVLNKKRA